MMKLLGPMIRSSCSSFEAAHQYFKRTARKQHFKNLPLSLAKRHQLIECSYFGVASDNFNSHPLFSSERTFGVLQSVSEEKRNYFRNKFDESALLPGIEDLTGIHKTSWIILFGTKYCKESLIAIGCSGNPPIPIFGSILNIWVLSDFVYFEVNVFEKRYFCRRFQAYRLANIPSEITQISPYENLVDYNVFYKKESNCWDSYVSVRYHLDDILEEYNNFRKSLRQ